MKKEYGGKFSSSLWVLTWLC